MIILHSLKKNSVFRLLPLIFGIVLCSHSSFSFAAEKVFHNPPSVVFSEQSFTLVINTAQLPNDTKGLLLTVREKQYPVTVNNNDTKVSISADLSGFGLAKITLQQYDGNHLASHQVSVIPGWLSLMPPLVAIAVALIWRTVIPALFAGICVGSWFLVGPNFSNLGVAVLQAFADHSVSALASESHVSIVMFTMMLGGMIGILAKNGGMEGIVRHLTKFTDSAKRGQLATATLGCLIFFDDIANTLLIGKTMRPICDRLRVSREKLAYLVDSTAAPIASVAFATTWIGYEVSVIESSIEQIPEFTMQPYTVFLSALPFSFYSFLTLFMVFCIAFFGRDYGPMLAAERRAFSKPIDTVDSMSTKQERPQAAKGSARNALLPIAILVITLIGGLLATGKGNSFQEILGTADSYKALLWASFLGALSAGVFTLVRRVMNLDGVVSAWVEGMNTTFEAMIVLVLSWALASVIQDLNTSQFLISFLGDKVNPALLPTLAFVMAGVIALTTGTSWGTMGIMMPLMLPLAWNMLSQQGGLAPQDSTILFASIASILAGATWGDHCSPISDTTILSSVASECDLLAHLRTQLPYALTTGALSIFLCTIPVGFGVPWWMCIAVSFACIVAIIRFYAEPI